MRFALFCTALIAWAGTAAAQSLPTSQPNMLLINIERIKLGQGVPHRITEAGWPVAYERAKSPNSYIALEAVTGQPEVWFVSPFESNAAIGESFRMEGEDRALSAELARLAKADAEHLDALRTIHAMGRKDLSHGAFPDTGRQRFFEITTFRMRPGGEAAFEAAAKAYGAAAGRAAPNVSYRIYEVVAGLPGPTYLIFSSTVSFGDFDKSMPDGMATMKAMTPQEQEAMQKFSEVMTEAVTQRYRLDPDMSYVSRAVRETDPAFWLSKK
jgi:hypothetical protein